jgi:hypothetical protein
MPPKMPLFHSTFVLHFYKPIMEKGLNMTAIWTPPRTWNVGELVTAGLLNTHLRDNLEFLKAQIDLPLNFASAASAALYTTTSTTFADVDATNLKLTFTTSGGSVLLGLSTLGKHSVAAGEIRLDWHVDGARIGDATYGIALLQAPTVNNYIPISHIHVLALSAGAHTLKLQFATTGATASIGGVSGGTSLWALELV